MIVVMLLSWWLMDVRADNVFQRLIFPLIFTFCAFMLFIKILLKLGIAKSGGVGSGGDGGSLGGGDGGGGC